MCVSKQKSKLQKDLKQPKYNRKNQLWQVNYNDHIIRNMDEYNRIEKYIIENPEKWKEDKFYK